jgi:hypothetical protein
MHAHWHKHARAHTRKHTHTRAQAAGQLRVHAAFAPACLGGAVHWVSARARVLRPDRLPAAMAAGAGGIRPEAIQRAVERAAARYGPCGPGCTYALLLAPAAALCPACAVPAGGSATLLTGRSESVAGQDGAVGEMEVAAWDGAEWAGAGPGPAALRIDMRSACWLQRECAVTLAVEDAGGAERRRQQSLLVMEMEG